MATVTPRQVARFRFRRHQLDRAQGSAASVTDVDLLDIGVQDTGPDGAAWALAIRGADIGSMTEAADDLALAWTLRGAPHAYRRADLKAVAVATAPWSEADAAKRIFDASKPLKSAGREVIDALREVATEERDLAATPIVKGDMSHALAGRLGEEFLRYCRPCDAIHLYEQPFRLSALQAGLELEPDTSPPVLRRVKWLRPNMFGRLADEADARFDVVRGVLRYFGPLTVKEATTFLDAANKDVTAHWPEGSVEVTVKGVSGTRHVLPDDVADLDAAADADGTPAVRLVGPYDGFLQARDREVLVADGARRKALWPVIGRPGVIVRDGEIVALWRPKTERGSFTLRVEPFTTLTKPVRAAIDVEAQRLADFRGVALKRVAVE